MNPKLTKNSFFNFPSLSQLPEMPQSLMLINTVNAFPASSSMENI